MNLTSSAFLNGGLIPKKYSRNGENINPPLAWKDIPEGIKSFAIIMEDPDVPAAAGIPVFNHWIVFNIPPTVTDIPEAWPVVGQRGAGTRGSLEYGGPRPPDREHRYFFYLYALDAMLPLNDGASKDDVLVSSQGHVLAKATLMGRYAPDNII
jgi:Raf kinase inhibitor-like YbhB/YbcL family protein